MEDRLQLLRTPGTRVFVASAFPTRMAASDLMDSLRKRGLVITCDWTKPSSTESRQEIAAADFQGVTSAQLLVAVMTLTDYDYKGTFTELGIALGAGVPILIITPFHKTSNTAVCARNVYWALPELVHGPTSVLELLTLI